ncbi:hypothetical protein AWZ03_010981 [Drosophila navojoa]|uniref:Gustatory receptor n=1 Tax=Drosophila navojoa TaxID=7232 RepID=A0A484B1E7_DRONA|nr:hypothetical protein AWZ03_010981 [Drosophila navojoa]
MRLLKFLHYQRYLGLNDLDYSKASGHYILKGSCVSYMLHSLVQAILIACILATFMQWSVNYQATDSRSGDNFDHLVILAASFTQLISNAWMRLHQQMQLKLLNILSRVATSLQAVELEKIRARWLYYFWLAICLYYALDIVFFVVFDMDMKRDHLTFLLGFYVRLVCANFIIICYSSLVCLVKHLFRAQAAQLQRQLRNERICLRHIANNLRLNDELMLLCQDELVNVFGGALVLPYLYGTLDATEVCYLALPMDGFSYMEMLLLLRWMIPICIFLSMPMIINDLADEILVNIWLRVKQESQLIILNRLTDWSRDFGVITTELNRPKWLYRIWMGISVLYACDIVFARFYFNVNQSFGYYLAMSGYIVLLVRTNYIIVCYTALVNLIMTLLEKQANQLQSEFTIIVDRLAENLRFHDKLFLLCHEQMVEVYGGSLVLLFLYTVLDAICTCYLASLEERFSFVEVLFVLCWIVPIFMSLIIPLTANNLTKQLVVLLIVFGSLHGVLTGECVYNAEMISKPVKAFYYLHLSMPPIIQILLNLCLRFRQQRQQLLLQRMKNFILTCYTSLVNVVSNLLQAQAAQLSRAIPDIHPDELALYLQTHDEIVLLCHEELVQVFGIALLACFIFLCQNSIFVAYLATLESRFTLLNVLGILSWMAFNTIYMYMPLKINNLAYELVAQYTKVMQSQELFAFLHYQRYLGLSDIDYSSCMQRYVLHATCCSRFAQLLVLCIMICALLEDFLGNRVDYVSMESTVGSAVYQILLLASPLTELLLHIWLHSQQHLQQDLLNRLMDLARRLHLDTHAFSSLRWLYRIWLAISVIYVCHILQYTIATWEQNNGFQQLLGLICICMHNIRIKYVITYYTALVYVVMILLQAQAHQLHMGDRIPLLEIASNLCIHDELLLLCHEELLNVFGVALIFPFLYFVLDATCICYIGTFVDRFSHKEVLLVLSWLTPIFFYMTLPLVVNNVANQVS